MDKNGQAEQGHQNARPPVDNPDGPVGDAGMENADHTGQAQPPAGRASHHAGNDEARWLVARIARPGGFGPASIDRNLATYPLGPASLSVRKHVLLVEDLTGGTTATATTYRYRFDASVKRMRSM